MNSDHVATIREALSAHRKYINATHPTFDTERHKRVMAIDAALAALDEDAGWEPVPDGFLADPNVSSWWMHATKCHITIGTKEGGYTYFLPDDIRLCRKRPRAQG